MQHLDPSNRTSTDRGQDAVPSAIEQVRRVAIATDESKLIDRLQIGATPPAMVQRVAELNMQRPPLVFEVPESGPIRVAEYSVGE